MEEVKCHKSEGFYKPLRSSQVIGGWRPVLDVSTLNLFVLRIKFHMETRQSVIYSIRRGDWMISLDMQDAYFHVPIHMVSRKYLRFIFQNRVFQFWALRFGPLTAPQVFACALAPLGKWLHLLRISISLYLDNWLLRSQLKERCTEDLRTTLRLTQELGILINVEKSQLPPTQEILYLGMVLNSQTWVFPAPKRIDSCLGTICQLLSLQVCSANQWMSLLGTLASIVQFVKLGKLDMRLLQFFLKASWDRRTQPDSYAFPITQEIKIYLQWWLCEGRLF